MIELNDLEVWRTVHNMKEYCKKIHDDINSNELLKKQARIKNKHYNFKEYLDEYLPLLSFVELYYRNIMVEGRYVGRKTQKHEQKYDAEINRKKKSKEELFWNQVSYISLL